MNVTSPVEGPALKQEGSTIRMDLLRAELSILNSKLNGTVNRLWKIRGLNHALDRRNRLGPRRCGEARAFHLQVEDHSPGSPVYS